MPKKIIVLFIFALWLVSCAINPVTGKKELSLFSEQGEIELGKETDPQIRQQYGLYSSAPLSAYVTGLGNRLVPFSHRPKLAYSFQVLDSPVVNAFAVPGGYVYVTRGALALMNTESELAVVLGHELGHIAARHSIRRMSEMILIQVGLVVAGTISKTVAEIAGVAGIGIQLLYLKFSRDDERQADALGVQYSRAARFNPGQMVNFFASLQKMGDMSGKSSLPGFLSTHPLNDERIKNVTALLTAGDQGLSIGREAYLRSINNIVYGDDPRQGYVENNAFYHPSMRFVFSIPQGWKVQNTPRQVTLASSDEQAAFVLRAEQSNDSLEAYAARKASELEGRQLLKEESLTINGLAAYSQLYD
ncbi:MAG: M48 family metalloprotease, partial [Candidatus Aminicenantes bacterium]|nr:M48 family metalloprotease [Candidatus Aminicenantes bacterium]